MSKVQKILIVIGCVFLGLSFVTFGLRQYVIWQKFSSKQYFLPPVSQIMNPKQTAFKFIVISDSGDNAVTLTQLLRDAMSHNPAFIIYNGDLVRRSGDKYFNYMTHVIDSVVGDTPVYFTPGNHDITVSKSQNKFTLSHYIKRLGQPFYWFGYGNTLFIALNSSDGAIDEQQWDFYKWTMQNVSQSFSNIIVYTHIPPVNAPGHKKRMQSDASAERMANMIIKYKPNAIFAGHVHYWSTVDFRGVPLYTAPASGQRPQGDYQEMGYLLATVDANGIHVQPQYIKNLSTDTQSSNIRRIIRATNGNISSVVLLIMMGLSMLFIVISMRISRKEN